MSISVEQIDENNMSELKDYILEKNKTTFVDLWDWRRLVEKNLRLLPPLVPG